MSRVNFSSIFKPKKEGIFVVNKPLGISSQRAVQFVKYWARKKTGNKKIRVGHCGTLDPLAEGVLVVAVGREWTKKIYEIVEAKKEYLAEVKLGEISSTDDREGEKIIKKVAKIPTKLEIEKAILKNFIGKISQIPPSFSAIKIQGEEAYKRVRKGEIVEMKARFVEIYEIEFLNYNYPILKIRVVCGKGTYIRSLARDLGEILATGGYLFSLQRTRVGQFTLKNAYEIFEFRKQKSWREICLNCKNRVRRFFQF
jgi:tRNA pseudouridine55 synthase